MHGSPSGFENVEPGTGWLMQVDTSAISASSGSPFWTTCTCVDVSEMALLRPDNAVALKWPTTWVFLLLRVCMKIELNRNDLIPRKVTDFAIEPKKRTFEFPDDLVVD